jgi:hypothetical protein
MYSQDLSTFRNAEKQGLTSPKNSPVIKACKDAFTLMVQVQSYNSDWNSAGTERIVEFAAKRNLANWNITSMNEDEPIVYGKMQGVTLDFYTDIKGIETKDFQSIFIGTGKDIEGVAFANGPGPITQPKTSNKVQKKTGHGGSTTTTTGPGPGKPKGGGSTTTTTGPGPGKPKGGSPTTTTTIKTPTTTTTYEIPTTTTTFIYAPTTTTTVAPTTTTTEELKGIEPVCVPDPPYVICTTGSNTSGNN